MAIKEQKDKPNKNQQVYLVELLKLFLDEDTAMAPFSIHKIAREAFEEFKLPIGEWFSPNRM